MDGVLSANHRDTYLNILIAGGENAIQWQIQVVVGEDTNNGMGVAGGENAIQRHVKSYRPLMRIIDIRKARGLNCKKDI